jgi:hypothetical protein
MILNGKFTGIKNSIPQTLNEVEIDYAISLEWDTEVKYYNPAQMETRIQKNPEKYLKMHFLVDKENGVKRLIHIHAGDLNRKTWDAVCKSLSNLNAIFTPISVKKIRKEPKRSNLEFLWQHAKRNLSVEQLFLLHEFFFKTEYPTIAMLQKYFQKQNIDPDLIYTMIFHKALVVNIKSFEIKAESHVIMNPKIAFLGIDWRRDLVDEMTFF